MAIDYHRCKKDTTHKAIANEFIIRGFSVVDTSPLKNACDFIATNGEKTYFVECKSKGGKLSEGEILFQNDFKAPVYNLESAQDAINLLDLGMYICPKKIERQLSKLPRNHDFNTNISPNIYNGEQCKKCGKTKLTSL